MISLHALFIFNATGDKEVMGEIEGNDQSSYISLQLTCMTFVVLKKMFVQLYK